MANFWKLVNKVIEDADVLLLVLDGRLVKETRNKEIEKRVKIAKKPLIFVLNKSDLVNKKDMETIKKKLKPSVFVSSKYFHGTTMLRERILIESKKYNIKEKKIKVGVLGYPNVGKSSLINALKGKKSAPSSNTSGYTTGIQKIRIDNRIILLDTPGVIPKDQDNDLEKAMIGTIDFNNEKEPDLVVIELMKKYPGLIESYYHVDIKDDKEETLENIGSKKNILKKGGIVDTLTVAKRILKDWQNGKINNKNDNEIFHKKIKNERHI